MVVTVTLRSFLRHALVDMLRRVDGRSINRVSFSPATTAVFMIQSMRGRMVAIGALVLAGSVGVGVASSAGRGGDAHPQACVLPGPVPCSVAGDPDCTQYGAICDTAASQCACVSTDLGSDLGPMDLAGADLPPSEIDGGATAGTPPAGGGMTSPPKSAGCSFVPGSP